METPIVLVVSLWLKGGDVAGLEAFEREASRIMDTHGGRIERVVRLDPGSSSPGEGPPFEVHVVTFPNRAAFERYGNDPRTRALGPRRQEIFARTEVLRGHDLLPY